jgi:hypothetical protein
MPTLSAMKYGDRFDHNVAHINDLRANHVNVLTRVCDPTNPAPLRESVYCENTTGLTRPHRTPAVRAIHT